MASAGVFYGVYPGEAEFACDVRTLPGMTGEQIRTDVEAFLASAMADDPELDAELLFEVYVPATEISPDEPVVHAVQSAAADVLDEQPELAAFPGATDAAYVQGTAGIPSIAAFGPGFLPRAHSPNESVSVRSIGQAARMYALAASRYLA
jgi:acetylornithine deacetylase